MSRIGTYRPRVRGLLVGAPKSIDPVFQQERKVLDRSHSIDRRLAQSCTAYLDFVDLHLLDVGEAGSCASGKDGFALGVGGTDQRAVYTSSVRSAAEAPNE